MQANKVCFHTPSNLKIIWWQVRSFDIIKIERPVVKCKNCNTVLPSHEDPAKTMLAALTERKWNGRHKIDRYIKPARLAY